jgi:hypothetical protein
MHYRKRPVVIEAWLASDLLYAAAKEWKLLARQKAKESQATSVQQIKCAMSAMRASEAP